MDIERLLQALILHRSTSMDLASSLARFGLTSKEYYSWRRSHRAEADDLWSQAEAEASQVRQARRERILAIQEDRQLLLMEEMMTGIEEGVPMLCKIARGEPWMAGTEGGRKKLVIPYPRDITAALTQLQLLLREGLLTEDLRVLLQNTDSTPQLPAAMFPGRLDFQKVEAVATDGTTVTVERPSTIEGEVVEVTED